MNLSSFSRFEKLYFCRYFGVEIERYLYHLEKFFLTKTSKNVYSLVFL